MVIKFIKACAINVAASVLITWAVLTSGRYFQTVFATAAAIVAVWALLATYRTTQMIIRSGYKKNSSDTDKCRFGFWLGALLSIVVLLTWTVASFNRVDL
jgi:hypothetical protein